MRTTRRRALAAISLVASLLLAGAFLSPPDARAHASFLESDPAPGARLAASPRAVTLEFTEPLVDGLTRARLLEEPGGEPIPAALEAGGLRMVMRPSRRLQQAAYRIQWRSVSTIDGHVREGSISFGVGVAPTEGLVVEESPRWARLAIRALLYVTLFFAAGGLAGAALLASRGRPAGWLAPAAVRGPLARAGVDPDAFEARAWRRTLGAARLAAVAAAATAVAEAADSAGGLRPGEIGDFLLTTGGGQARLGVVAALLGAALVAPRAPRAAAGLGAAGLLAIALGGHASSAEPKAAAVATDLVHLLAGAIWVGGIAQIATAWLPTLRRAGDRELGLSAARAVLARFGRIALPAFLVVAATGLTNALIQLGHLEALWETSYGRVLALKVVLVAAIALASYLHAFRIQPRLLGANPHPARRLERWHSRLIASQPLVGVAVLAAAALLVAFPLAPGQLGEEAAGAASPCDPYCPFAQPRADEVTVAAPAGPLTVAAWMRREGRSLHGTLVLVDRKRQPATVRARVRGAAEQRPCGPGCWRFELPGRPPNLVVSIAGPGGDDTVTLPARWAGRGQARARALLARSQRTMRALRTLRQRETVRSAVATPAGVTSPAGTARYAFRAPNRMAFRTTRSVEAVQIGRRYWFRSKGAPWKRQPPREVTRINLASSRFRWTLFERSARLLDVTERGGRRIARLAFLDHGYPVWYTLDVDLASGRALRASLVTPDNRIEQRYFGFNAPTEIAPPR